MNVNLLKQLWLLMATAVFAIGCSDNDDPFEGRDNYITSFSLTQGDALLTAQISGEEIILSAPENFSLDNAKAVVGLSENAKISPDPSQVTDWDNEQIFVVTSHNNQDRTYKYKINRVNNICAENVTLNTQADVKEFAGKGYTAVAGNLVVGEYVTADPVTSLELLADLRVVSKNLVINAAYAGENLKGLENLKSVGSLMINSATGIVEIEMTSLEEVTANVIITGANVYGVNFPALKKIGGKLDTEVPVKTFSFPALQQVGADLHYVVTEEALLESLLFQNLSEVGGQVFIEKKLNIKTSKLAKVDFPKLKKCAELLIGDVASLNILYFPLLEEVGGQLEMAGSEYIDTNFKALKKVQIWTICGLASDLDLRGMNVGKLVLKGKLFTSTIARKVIGDDVFNGDISLESVLFPIISVKNIPAFEGFKEVNSITISGFRNTKVEFSFPETEIVHGDINLSVNGNISKINCFPVLKKVEGNINTGDWTAFADATVELPKLQSVGGNFTTGFLSVTPTKLSLPALTEVGGDFIIGTGQKLAAIQAPALKTVKGTLHIVTNWKVLTTYSTKNAALTNLDGFSTLENVGSVSVLDQSVLVSYKGLQNAFGALSVEKWNALGNGYNPDYDALKAGNWEKDN